MSSIPSCKSNHIKMPRLLPPAVCQVLVLSTGPASTKKMSTCVGPCMRCFGCGLHGDIKYLTSSAPVFEVLTCAQDGSIDAVFSPKPISHPYETTPQSSSNRFPPIRAFFRFPSGFTINRWNNFRNRNKHYERVPRYNG